MVWGNRCGLALHRAGQADAAYHSAVISHARASDTLHQLHGTTGANLEVPGRGVRLSALGLRRDPHGYVKQIHHEELVDCEKKRPTEFPQLLLKPTDSAYQPLTRP